jgi:hypothetical protein
MWKRTRAASGELSDRFRDSAGSCGFRVASDSRYGAGDCGNIERRGISVDPVGLQKGIKRNRSSRICPRASEAGAQREACEQRLVSRSSAESCHGPSRSGKPATRGEWGGGTRSLTRSLTIACPRKWKIAGSSRAAWPYSLWWCHAVPRNHRKAIAPPPWQCRNQLREPLRLRDSIHNSRPHSHQKQTLNFPHTF